MGNVKKSYLFKTMAFLILLAFCSYFTGCATIPEAIEHRNLYVGAKMSHSIFLDPIKRAKLHTIYIEVKNTSQLQKFNPEELREKLASDLSAKGYQIVSDPTKAGYMLMVNARYFDEYSVSGAKEGAVKGAAAAGAAVLANANDVNDLILAALAAGGGYIGGALVGSMIKIKTFAGVVDVQIMERTEKPVTKEVVTNASQGEATTIYIRQAEKTNYQIYRTSIAVTATKTNLKEEEAAKAVINKLAYEIANIF